MNYSLRTMLVGIALIMIGIYVQNDPETALHGYDFLFVILGFALVIAGCFKKVFKKIFDAQNFR